MSERRRRRSAVKDVLVRAFGRPLVCANCGRQLCLGLPVVWRGRVRVLGVGSALVRVSFATKDTLEFQHVDLCDCPAPERPWVS